MRTNINQIYLNILRNVIVFIFNSCISKEGKFSFPRCKKWSLILKMFKRLFSVSLFFNVLVVVMQRTILPRRNRRCALSLLPARGNQKKKRTQEV